VTEEAKFPNVKREDLMRALVSLGLIEDEATRVILENETIRIDIKGGKVVSFSLEQYVTPEDPPAGPDPV
jgi:hypothetical protein